MPGRPRRPQKPSSEELLETEFDYIARTAFQANEDRAHVSSFYLVAVGPMVAALFSTQFFDKILDRTFELALLSGITFGTSVYFFSKRNLEFLPCL